jgi:PleD family two-component response regulator
MTVATRPDSFHPLRKAANTVMWPPACSDFRQPVATERQHPRALVVDDFDGAREAVRLVLDALGYEAQGVATGAEALGRLAQATYAVVISDLVMPGVSGWMMAEYVRRY